ncbi:hypothetical protein PILCRDRAFT_616307 [Piloderma croceum F 1598]|uniref:Zn(2)-C6 fungal-type domain-containing protein n=1 Tax=Piloderma croceum (strain F 1598) TaxID=765440 RepID=A0A0C3BJD8_PILCF|nr:hypothetical protein PILCRDRAFT_616307 [Piloderma croceum F 1598]
MIRGNSGTYFLFPHPYLPCHSSSFIFPPPYSTVSFSSMKKARSSSQCKRTFKNQRASIACICCHNLKKACKHIEQQRCQRCTRTNRDCIFKRVADDTTPQAAGSLPPAVEPDSATNVTSN